MKVKILLTNDDGFQSIGFYPLLKVLHDDFDVTAVVPDGQRSWMGKSISKGGKLVVKESKLEGIKIFTCSGTPADCVQIGIYDFFEGKPDLVISGINIGTNMGHGYILSSGTVGAAMEASIDGVKALSSSLYIPPSDRPNINFFDTSNYHIYQNAAKITKKVAKIVLENNFSNEIDLFTLNIPYLASEDSEFEITKPYREPYGKLFNKQGDLYIHNDPPIEIHGLHNGSDMKAVFEGKISITPLNLELVSKNSLESVRETFKNNWY